MPFNQAFTFPHQLTLRTTADGVRLFAEPVREIEKLYGREHVVEDKSLSVEKPAEVSVEGELFDVRASFEVGDAEKVGLDIGGNRIVYDVQAQKLLGAELATVNGEVEIRALVDRPMMEIIGNRGRVYITEARGKRGAVSSIRAFTEGDAARLVRLEVRELKSIWKK